MLGCAQDTTGAESFLLCKETKDASKGTDQQSWCVACSGVLSLFTGQWTCVEGWGWGLLKIFNQRRDTISLTY